MGKSIVKNGFTSGCWFQCKCKRNCNEIKDRNYIAVVSAKCHHWEKFMRELITRTSFQCILLKRVLNNNPNYNLHLYLHHHHSNDNTE